MGNGRKTEEQLTQEIMQLVNQLYDTMKGEPEAIQERIASVLASSAENAAQKENEENRIKTRKATELAKSGKETNLIMQETGLTVAAIRWIRKKEGIMSRGQVRDLIIDGKGDDEVKNEANWTLDAVKEMRKEIEDRRNRRKADRKERSDKRNAMLKEQRRAGIEERREEQEAKDQKLRIGLAKGLSIDEIAALVGYQYPHTVSVKKSQKGLLGRKEISALLPEKSDEELMGITGIKDISVIQQVRQEEMPKIEAAKKAEEERQKQEEEKQRRKEAEEARNQAFLIALAQGKKGEEIAKLVGLKNAGSVKQKKHDMKALSRKQIIALLPEKSDEELMDITGIKDISIIQQIRQEEMPETVPVKKVEPVIPKQDEATFLKLAQSLTSVKSIARELGLTEEQIRKALYDYNIFTREEVVEWLDSKSDVQIAIMGNLDDYRIVEKVRKEERERMLAEEPESDMLERPIDTELQKKKEDAMFLRMAKNYEPVEKIGSAFQMNEYKVILRLRKLKLYSRPEVERMIEEGELSDIKIAGIVGNVNAVARIRRKIQKRELLIRSISEDKRVRIKEKIAVGTAVSSIAYDTRINLSTIIAIQEKWKRDKDLQVPEERKKVNLKIDWLHLEANIRAVTVKSPNTKKNSIEYTIEKILVMYATLLTQRHYAYIAYAYMKMGRYMDGIEFAEDYLNLENSSIKGVKDRIGEILEQEKEKEKSGVTASLQNMRIEWTKMEDLGK